MGEGRAGEGAQKSEKIYGKWTKFEKMNKNLGKTYNNGGKRRGKLGGVCGKIFALVFRT